VQGAAPLTFNAPPSGSLTLTEKITINSNGLVVREFFFSDFSCSK
jgi:hypothetical protein